MDWIQITLYILYRLLATLPGDAEVGGTPVAELDGSDEVAGASVTAGVGWGVNAIISIW